MIDLLGPLLAFREARQARAFEAACRDPEGAQRALLQAMLAREANTAFGRDHGFASLKGPADYAKAVPIRDHEGLRPYLDRVVAGEPGVLTNEAPMMFTTTSGTTGQPKLIPVPPTWREAQAGLFRLWLRAVHRDHPKAFHGQIFSIVSPAVEELSARGLPIGAMSGVAYQRIPWLIRRRYAVPYAAFLIADPVARYLALLRLALAQDVSLVGTPNASTLRRLGELAEGHAEALIRAIHDGGYVGGQPVLKGPPGMPTGEFLADLQAAAQPNPMRAMHLATLVERAGRLRLADAWPGLGMVSCWLGGSAGLQAAKLGPYFGNPPMRDFGLIASEGRFTLPLADGSPEGVLALHQVYAEFVPEDEEGLDGAKVLGAHQLERGGRYLLTPTPGNGLYRYHLADVVEVRGFHRKAPILAFLRKGKDFANLTGEKLHQDQLLAAIAQAAQALGLPLRAQRLIPDAEAMRHDLLVEPEEEVQQADAGQWRLFAKAVDEALARLNPEYAMKRASGRLGAPLLHVMRSGWAEGLAIAAFRSGVREAQHKWVVMAKEWDEASRQAVRASLEA